MLEYEPVDCWVLCGGVKELVPALIGRVVVSDSRMEELSKNGWDQCCARVARVSGFNLPEVRLLPVDLVEDGGKELRF